MVSLSLILATFLLFFIPLTLSLNLNQNVNDTNIISIDNLNISINSLINITINHSIHLDFFNDTHWNKILQIKHHTQQPKTKTNTSNSRHLFATDRFNECPGNSVSCCKPEEYDGVETASNKQACKVLFLGSGGCGKSTIFKQLKTLYGEGFTNKDRKDAVHSIAAFVVETMQTLLDDETCNIDEWDNEEAKNAAHQIQQISTNSSITLTKEIASNLKILWSEQLIKDLFDETAKLYLNGPCSHFFNSIDRISSESFEPTDKDILMQRRPTTGLIEQWIGQTSYKDIKFQMVDVGGQKNERRKWIHHFENVSAIVYVISLAAYDEQLYEEENINSLHDAIELFKSINESDSHWFRQSSLFLVFNKKDLFKPKIINKSLKECFDGYDNNEYDEKKYFDNCENHTEEIAYTIDGILGIKLGEYNCGYKLNKERLKSEIKNKLFGDSEWDMALECFVLQG